MSKREEGGRATVECELPSGKKVILRELDGEAELHVAEEIGELRGAKARVLAERAEILRMVVAVNGEPFEASSHTAATFRGLFSQKDWTLLTLARAELVGVDEKALAAFRERLRFTAS